MSDRSQEPGSAPLKSALEGLFGHAEPPASLRADLSRAARERLGAASPEPLRVWRPRPLVAALAVAAGVGLLLWAPWQKGRSVLAPNVADLDGSGRVDVWDAYLLAIAVEDGAVLDPTLDLNGDGRVDREDADGVARLAVKLPR